MACADCRAIDLVPDVGNYSQCRVSPPHQQSSSATTAVRFLLFQRCIDEFGRVDALVNNAAIYESCHFLDITEEHWGQDSCHRSSRTSLRGLRVLTQGLRRGPRGADEPSAIAKLAGCNGNGS